MQQEAIQPKITKGSLQSFGTKLTIKLLHLTPNGQITNKNRRYSQYSQYENKFKHEGSK